MIKRQDTRDKEQIIFKIQISKKTFMFWNLGLVLCLSFVSCVLFLASTVFADLSSEKFFKIYFVSGTVTSNTSANTAGRQVIFYRTQDELDSGIYSKAIASSDGRYTLIPSLNPLLGFNAGDRFKIAVPQGLDGYGAAPIDILISGGGFDQASNLVLASKQGPTPPPPPLTFDTPPAFDWIKFGDRHYQKDLVARGDKFIVPATPKITAKIRSVSAIEANNVTIVINENTANSQSVTLKESNILSKGTQSGGNVSSLAFSYEVPADKKLIAGENKIKFIAKNAGGQTVESTTVTVMAGDLSVVGPVLQSPSPFAPARDGNVTIQYTLSANANIDVFILSPTGEIVKKFVITSGTAGGTAGVNKIQWDGKFATGMFAGNAIYAGAIVARDNGKVLASFRVAVVTTY